MQGFLLFSLAELLHVDIDVVRRWSLRKVLEWKKYFELKGELIGSTGTHNQTPEKSADRGGVHFMRRGDRVIGR